MDSTGHIQNGAIVPDEPLSLREGTRIRFTLKSDEEAKNKDTARQGGQLNGQIQIADDFNDLPSDIAQSFGMESR